MDHTHKKGNAVISARQCIAVLTAYFLMVGHDMSVRFKKRTESLPSAKATPGKVYFFYCTCGRDFKYLVLSLKSLELLQLDCLGKVYLYIDKKDPFTSAQTKELKDSFTFLLETRITRWPLAWGGVRLLLLELAAFEEINTGLSPEDLIFKTDSDVLFISDKIFKKAVSENHDAMGQRTSEGFMEGGSYFLKSSLVRKIVRSPNRKAIHYSSTSWDVPITMAPEDRAISSLVKQNTSDMVLSEYRLSGYALRGAKKGKDIEPYSVIHFSPFYNFKKEQMFVVWDHLFSE